MDKFNKVVSHAAPLNAENVDTDTIVPKQFLKWIGRTGYGDVIFYEWRYHKDGTKKDFILNTEQAQSAQILLTRKNFGSGSSREHAPWGIKEYGFQVIIAPSFAEIFYQNSIKNGILPITLPEDEVLHFFDKVEANPSYQFTVDLELELLKTEDGDIHYFHIDPFFKNILLNGLDDIGLTLEHMDGIRAFEKTHQVYYQSPGIQK